jgi:hypothetical protein
LEIGHRLNDGGYNGGGVEDYAADVFIPWWSPDLYLGIAVNTLLVFVLLILLWRALDWFVFWRSLNTELQVANSLTQESNKLKLADFIMGSGQSKAQAKSQNETKSKFKVKPKKKSQKPDSSFSVLPDNKLTASKPTDSDSTQNSSQTDTRDDLSQDQKLVDAADTTTKSKIYKQINKRWIWLCFFGLLICWIPFWLAVWPGIYNYDANLQYEMLQYDYLWTHHPILHTLLLDYLVIFGQNFLGDANGGVALYVGLQLLVMSTAFTLMLRTMAEEGAGKVLLTFSFLFFAVNPALVLWLLPTTKDVLFTGFAILLILIIYRTSRKSALIPQQIQSQNDFLRMQTPLQEDRPLSFQESTQHDSLSLRQSAQHEQHEQHKQHKETSLPLDGQGTPQSQRSSRDDNQQDSQSPTWDEQMENSSYWDYDAMAVPVMPAQDGDVNGRLKLGICIAVAILTFLFLAFRTSAIISLVVFLPFAIFWLRRHVRIRLLISTLIAIVLFIGMTLAVSQIINITGGPWQQLDALSLPRQQLARVWAFANNDDASEFRQVFSAEDLEYLSDYQADDADTSRSAFLEPFNNNYSKLTQLYISQGLKHPGTYADAVFLTNYEAWYPGAVVDGYVMDGYDSDPSVAKSSYIFTNNEQPASNNSLLPAFGHWLQQFGWGNIASDYFAVRLLCSPATYLWILLIALARSIIVRSNRSALVCVFLLTIGAAALLSPIVVVRYYLPVIFALPLLLMTLTKSET